MGVGLMASEWQNAFAKLPVSAIPKIRIRVEQGETSCSVASSYGVRCGTIQNVVNGKSWSFVV